MGLRWVLQKGNIHPGGYIRVKVVKRYENVRNINYLNHKRELFYNDKHSHESRLVFWDNSKILAWLKKITTVSKRVKKEVKRIKVVVLTSQYENYKEQNANINPRLNTFLSDTDI